MSDFSKITEIKKTKIDHKCFMCFRVFSPSSLMYRWNGVFEGTFFHSVICPTCKELIPLLDAEDGIGGGDVINYMDDHGCATPEDLLDRLVARLKEGNRG